MADSVITKPVIKEIRRKGSSGFETPIKIGADQNFVSALLNSHNNNLEEQSILGVDCLSIEWRDDNTGIGYITKRFLDAQNPMELIDEENRAPGYYILFVTDYSDADRQADFRFEGTTLHIPEYDTSGAYYEVDGDSSTLVATKPDIFYFESMEADPTALIIRPAKKIKEELLCFRTDIEDTSEEKISSDIPISLKITVQKMKGEGSNIKVYNQSSIKNF